MNVYLFWNCTFSQEEPYVSTSSGQENLKSSTNVHCYFPVQLSGDQMYLTAIRNLARPSTGSTAPSVPSDPNISVASAEEEPGQLAKSYNSERAKSMLYSIKDKEMAIAAAKWIAQQLPLGNYMPFVSVIVVCLRCSQNFVLVHARYHTKSIMRIRGLLFSRF